MTADFHQGSATNGKRTSPFVRAHTSAQCPGQTLRYNRPPGTSGGRSTVYDWVGDILAREKEERAAKVLRLSCLGWTQAEIAPVGIA